MRAENVIWKGQVRLIEDAVEAWREAHRDEAAVLHVEELMRIGVGLCAHAKRIVKQTREQLFAGEIKKPLKTGERLREICETARRALEEVHALALDYSAAGYEVEGVAEHARAVEELQRLQEEVKATWPQFDLAELQAALDDPRPPIPVEDILRELQGPGAA